MRLSLLALFLVAAACDSTDPQVDEPSQDSSLVSASDVRVVPDTLLYAKRDTLYFDASDLFVTKGGRTVQYEYEADHRASVSLSGSRFSVAPSADLDLIVRASVGDDVAEVAVPIRTTYRWCVEPPPGSRSFFELEAGDHTFDVIRTDHATVAPDGFRSDTLRGTMTWSIQDFGCWWGRRNIVIDEFFDGLESSTYLQMQAGDTLVYERKEPTPTQILWHNEASLDTTIFRNFGRFWDLREWPDRFYAMSADSLTVRYMESQTNRYDLTMYARSAPIRLHTVWESTDRSTGIRTTRTTTLRRTSPN